jgi:hypothetical protein
LTPAGKQHRRIETKVFTIGKKDNKKIFRCQELLIRKAAGSFGGKNGALSPANRVSAFFTKSTNLDKNSGIIFSPSPSRIVRPHRIFSQEDT